MGFMGFLVFIVLFALILVGIGHLVTIVGLAGLLHLRNRQPKGKVVLKVILSLIFAIGVLLIVVPVGFFIVGVIDALVYMLIG